MIDFLCLTLPDIVTQIILQAQQKRVNSQYQLDHPKKSQINLSILPNKTNNKIMESKYSLSTVRVQQTKKINFVKPKRSLHSKIKSDSCQASFEQFQETDRERRIAREYQSVAQQSLEKNYHVANLRPYSAYVPIDTVRDQMNKTVQQNPKWNKQLKLNGNVPQRLSSLIKNAKNSRPRKKRTNRTTYVKSSIEDQHMSLIEDFDEEERNDNDKKSIMLKKLNNKIKTVFPEHQEIDPHRKVSYPTQTKAIQMNYKRKRVKQQFYEPFYPKNSSRRKRDYKMIFDEKDRQVCGTYSRSARRTLKTYFAEKKQVKENDKNVVRNSMRSIQASKVFYSSYMGSYSQRKKVLKSCKQILNQDYHQLKSFD